MAVSLPIAGAVRGRGAQSNRSGRFEPTSRDDFDDGWGERGAALPRLDDTLTALTSRTIISRNTSPDIGFDQSINPYIGCSHGCIYCYARPAHAYMGLSPGLDFETKLFFKPDAAKLLEGELSKPGYVVKSINIGGNTDPYQPAERELKITRGVLEVLQRFNHPFSIITKSALIARDADILGEMGSRGLAKTFVSVTTLDRALARAMEPRAATPQRRLDAVRALVAAGAPTGVMFAPAIPGLNDHEMEAVLEAAAKAGAVTAGFVVLRLPLEIKDLFYEWLEAERPDRASRVRSLIRQTRGGRDYDADWSQRMKGTGPIAELLAQRFRAACRRLGLNVARMPLRTDLFRPPPKPGDQIDLFSRSPQFLGQAIKALAAR